MLNSEYEEAIELPHSNTAARRTRGIGMDRKEKNTKTVRPNRETLRPVDDGELQQIFGGAPGGSPTSTSGSGQVGVSCVTPPVPSDPPQ